MLPPLTQSLPLNPFVLVIPQLNSQVSRSIKYWNSYLSMAESCIGANPFADITGAIAQNYTPTTGLATTTDFQRIAVATFNGETCNDTTVTLLR